MAKVLPSKTKYNSGLTISAHDHEIIFIIDFNPASLLQKKKKKMLQSGSNYSKIVCIDFSYLTAFCMASSKVLPIDITSPTLVMELPSLVDTFENFLRSHLGIFTTQ